MTRKEAIETAEMVIVEMNRRPNQPGVTLSWAEGIVATLIALEVLKVDDEAK